MENGIEEFSTGMWGVFLEGEQIACVTSEKDANDAFYRSAGARLKAARREINDYRDFVRGISLNINNMLKP